MEMLLNKKASYVGKRALVEDNISAFHRISFASNPLSCISIRLESYSVLTSTVSRSCRQLSSPRKSAQLIISGTSLYRDAMELDRVVPLIVFPAIAFSIKLKPDFVMMQWLHSLHFFHNSSTKFGRPQQL